MTNFSNNFIATKFTILRLLLLFIAAKNNALKVFRLKPDARKKPFGYRVTLHGYILTSCQEMYLLMITYILLQLC